MAYQPIKYLSAHYRPDQYRITHVPIPCKRPGLDQFGYGRSIASDYMIRIKNGTPRRIYHTCVSNCASTWVKISGTVYHFHDSDFTNVKKR